MDILAKAFLSYAHADNERETGRILRLASHIKSEFELLTGSTIEIFTDSAEILWGQDFRQRLNEALQETTFFIPVLTPTYFMRDECRKEMNRFVVSASELGLSELLLSLRYIPVPDLREDSVDDLKAVAAQMQFEPWDQLRLEDEQSTEHRRAVNKLASRLVQLTQDLEGGVSGRSNGAASPGAALVAASAPTLPNGNPPETTPNASRDLGSPTTAVEGLSEDTQQQRGDSEVYDDDDEPGLLDLVAEAQPAMEMWGATLSRLPAATEAFNAKFAAATKDMNAANSNPNSFANKVQVARRLAAEVEPELRDIEQLSKDYSTGLLRLDPSIRALFELVVMDDDAANSAELAAFVQSIGRLADGARTAFEGTNSAADAARTLAKLSKDLRPILRRFETAMRNIGDGAVFIEAWESLAPGSIRELIAH